jgi:YD repeat-containing protein
MTGRITARRFVAGRGNLTKVTRYDVVNASTIVAGETKYNTTGSPVAQITPWDGTNTRTVKIFYADNFNSSGNPATYAYPTTLTDPNSQSSTVKYRYDIGANVEATSPAPAGQSVGKTTKRVFDSVGRLERDSIYVSTAEKAYTRYAFPTNGIQAQSYSTLVDANSNGYPDSSDEVYAESWYDGAGRTRQLRTEHPGSTGGWTGTLTDYDILGRVARTSVPTEINSSYQASGDDATRGFIYNYQYFDWKNRPIRTVPSDSTSSDGKDTLITYEGCGCAGGQVTTVKGPVTTAVDVGGTTQTTKRRTQKAYEDILGRTYKTEVWDLDGGGSAPYSTTKTTFNGRDQATLIRQYSGGDTSSTYQDTTMSYDGHGRLYQSHKPEQRDGTTLKYTTYSYNPDNSILNATDGRGAVTAYTYNNQGLPTNIAWTVPGGSGITDPADVTFSYDALGNRTEMNDGPGKVIYSYDSLSKLISELREFDDVIPGAPEANNGYELNYTYHMGGTLKSMTEPLGVTVNYSADKTGRLTGVVPASAFGGVSTFASNAQYWAWGALKHLEYGNGVVMNQTFTNRQQSDTFTLGTSGTGVMNKTYDYYADGSLRHVDDALNGKFDRLNTYDHQGRIYQAKSSAEASGGTTSNPYYDRPYLQTYTFDAFDNLQNRENKLWNASANTAQNYTFTNNRITNTSSPFSYDNDGRVVQTPYTETLTDTTYDAAGRIDLYHSKASPTQQEDKITRHYDGDGREAKRVTDRCRIILPEDPEDPCTWQGGQNSYYIRSTVLGGAPIPADATCTRAELSWRR